MRPTSLLTLALSGLVAAKGDDKPNKGQGRYVTTVNGRAFNSAEYKEKDLACQGTVAIRGINNGFDVECATLNVFNYAFTGADTGGSTYWPGTSLKPFC